MDNKLFEICKEAYKRFPEWSEPKEWFGYVTENAKRHDDYAPLRVDYEEGNNIEWIAPLYTSDYLLGGKIPPVIQSDYDKKFKVLQISCNGDGSFSLAYVEPYDKEFRGEYIVNGDKDLRIALLKLVIALDDAGDLKG